MFITEGYRFFLAYSTLPFNRGVVFKRIGTLPEFLLTDVIQNISKEVYEVVIQDIGNIERINANIQVHDIIFDLLTHKDIDKKWRYIDDAFFSEISLQFNTKERFRKIGLFEVTMEDFANRLWGMAMLGACYGRINSSEQEIKTMIQDFLNKLLSDSDRVIVSTQPWGDYIIGWFTCFFIIRKMDIVIFGVDDYD